MKSFDPTLIQNKAKEALQKTAKNLCSSDWDANSGYGMIQAEAAFKYLDNQQVTLAHAMWTHGTSVHEEFSDRFKYKYKKGFYTIYEGKLGTSNWFHFAIDSVILMFLTDPDVRVTSVHIYDGPTKIASYDGLSITGRRLFERFDVVNRLVRFGIGISIGVKFGKENHSHRIAFVSAGGDFIRN